MKFHEQRRILTGLLDLHSRQTTTDTLSEGGGGAGVLLTFVLYFSTSTHFWKTSTDEVAWPFRGQGPPAQ